MRFVLALLLACLCLPALAQQAPPPDPVLQGAVDGVIRPNIIGFTRDASGLVRSLDVLCAAPSASAMAIASGQFRETALAYGRIELFRLGPLLEDNRADRLLFWPDRNGIGLRQLQAILAAPDEAVTDPILLRDKSVALQGLGALEYLLFGSDAATLETPAGNFRCRFGLAIAKNVETLGQELATRWYRPGGIATHLLWPDPANADYRTRTEAAEELVGLLAHGLEAVRDTRINPFIAKGETAAKPKQALFWRSGLTVPMLRANLRSLHDLFLISGVALAVDPETKGLGNSIEFEFRNASRAIAMITAPVEQALADPKQAQALAYLVIVTQSLQAMIGEQLSAELGLSVGFSALDRD